MRGERRAGEGTEEHDASSSAGDVESVIRGACQGESSALGLLYRRFHPSVVAYLRARLPAEAEDIASQVWLEVARGLPRFRGDEAGFRAWVFTIARLRLLDEFRRQERTRVEPVSEEAEALEDPEDTAEHAVSRAAAQAAAARLARLPARHAEVLLLRVVGGLSVDETARILGKRPGAVRVMQHRALKYLARELRRNGDG